MSSADDTASDLGGLDPRRAVQIITTLRAGPVQLGSGYRVSGDAVLTAAHVVNDAVSVVMRFITEDGGTAELPGEPVWSDSAVDIAVLKITSRASTGESCAAEVARVQFARITQRVDCEALGFPLFKLRADTASPAPEAPRRFRDSHHALATTTPWSDLRAGSLEISADPPGAPEPDRSPWEGMSGAAVWSGGYVIGVVSEHHRADGWGRLAASQVKRWYGRLTPAQISELNDLIGLPRSAYELMEQPPPPLLPRPPSPDLSEPHGAPEVQKSAKELAREVHTQWRDEERQQQVHDPLRLDLRFRCTHRNVFDHWANIRLAPLGADPGPLPLSGRLRGIVGVYRSVPSRRLVVLGGAGSGKTILTRRFVLDCLSDRVPGDRVPVIFGLGSWDPATESLDDWLCGQLVRDYPFLAAPVGRGGTLADVLLDEDRILPVLDGFDEIASGLYGAALEALNLTTRPLLLTSRPEEYSQAVKEEYGQGVRTRVLTGAAVIELEDLTVDDYADYLRRTSPLVRGNGKDTSVWEPALRRLREEPCSPGAANLAAVLTSPLMVALAGAICRGTGRDPATFLEFATREDLEAHLLADFIPAVYGSLPTTGRGTSHRRHRHWTPERTRRWLGYLAAHLKELDTHDLAWWQLGTTSRRSSRILVVGFLAALAFGVTTAVQNLPVDLVAASKGLGFAITRGLLVGFLHGLVAGLAFGVVYGFMSKGSPVEPSRLRIQVFGGSRARRAKFLPRFTLGLRFGGAAALVLELLDRCVVAPLGYDDGLSGGLVGGLLFPLEVGLGAGLVLGIMAWLEVPIDTESEVSASDLLSANRRNVVFHMLVWMLVLGLPAGLVFGFGNGPVRGLPAWLGHGPLRGLLGGLVFGLTAAFGGGLGYGLSFTAWGQWVALARIWLPLTGRLPWAVIAFLEDAHQRGVLRRAGAVYQFRHARLEDHLTCLFEAQHHSGPARRSPGTAGPEPDPEPSATRGAS
ncbi:NACHT domain-containing protein [Streptomyces sp. CT34]|uniref:NACHT domain-containing protein n=1 Tax=Streptomyces sp. CT34 TaxID=1553907 RepID=UPI00068BA03A|nr:NACHT domain-containing protein [Streptomyces sp. CT34]